MDSLFGNKTCNSLDTNQNGRFVNFETTPWKRGKTTDIYRGCPNGKGQLSQDIVCVKVGQQLGWNEKCCRAVVSKCEKVQELAKSFNSCNYSSAKFDILVPRMALMDDVAVTQKLAQKRSLSSKEWVLFEEKIKENFQIFVDKNGLNRSQTVLSPGVFVHFTYHASCGDIVASGLKGNNSKNRFKLSNPTVHSVNKQFGESDDGLDGIETVFKNHKCNHVCKDWLLPGSSDGLSTFFSTDMDDERCEPTAPFLEDEHSNSYNASSTIYWENPQNHVQSFWIQNLCSPAIYDNQYHRILNQCYLTNVWKDVTRYKNSVP